MAVMVLQLQAPVWLGSWVGAQWYWYTMDQIFKHFSHVSGSSCSQFNLDTSRLWLTYGTLHRVKSSRFYGTKNSLHFSSVLKCIFEAEIFFFFCP